MDNKIQSDDSNYLIGSWVTKKPPITITYTFTKDTFVAKRIEDMKEFGRKIQEIRGIYIICGSRILLTSDNGQVHDYPFEVKGNTLDLNGVIYSRLAGE